ncbi:transglutaminase family protein [Aquimarina sp. TRL1]|uniref:transglutaminase-like domain-containing protein n=1 Tax=Aquimarina sp. (strain TRL1) TaxID=2736252 RepID=UPI001588470D|nr:transglutaminase family protein [Aquimarina sp. TRL1]QKX07047.1 transglutaminase family protein [Aquimarina sp. TRL1]
MNNIEVYLQPTRYIDYRTDEIQQIVGAFLNQSYSQKEIAIQLYLTVRDQWRYNPYHLSFTENAYKASTIAVKKEGHCVDKSILLIACLRAVGIPARIHLAKVKNHIAVERLTEKFGTNEITPHGMVNLFLEGSWVKVSPAFNKELCYKCNVPPLDFDGKKDAIFQQYDNTGNLFMEYLDDYGHFEDIPTEFIFENFKANYPHIYKIFEGSNEIQL